MGRVVESANQKAAGESMKYDDNVEKQFAAIFGVVGTLSIVLGLVFKGFNLENVLDAVKDISGFIVGIAVFLIAAHLSQKSRTFLDVANDALAKLQRTSQGVLEGPKYDKSDYGSKEADIAEDAENPKAAEKTKRMQYLFFSAQSWNKKVAFVPLDPLEEGILDIRVSKATLVNLGYASADATAEKIAEVQAAVSRDVNSLIGKYGKDCQIMYSKDPSIIETGSKPSRYANSAIIIDFDEKALGFKKFQQFILECGQSALTTILKYKK